MSKSQAVVAALIDRYPEVQASGFAKSLRTHFPECPELCAPCPFVPDAFAIYPEDREVNVIEVVDSHPISGDKGRLIYKYADLLLGFGWNLSVIVYDSEGQISARVHGVSFLPFLVRDGARNAIPAAVSLERSGSQH